MRKIIAIVLLLLLSFNASVYYLFFTIKQQQIRQAMKTRIKAGVSPKNLVVIVWSSSNAEEFKWEHSREFSFHGQMFDVVRSEPAEDGSVLYHCVTDHQETLLFANLKQWVDRQMDQDPLKTGISRMLGFLLNGLFSPPVSHVNIVYISSQIIHNHLVNLYKSPFLSHFSPPPVNL